MLPPRKPRACIPCHERKVRCNCAEVGMPCTRCINKQRTHECMLVARLERSSNRRRQGHSHRAPRSAQGSTASEPPESNDNGPIVVAPSTPMSLPGRSAADGAQPSSSAASAFAPVSRDVDGSPSRARASESLENRSSVSLPASGLPGYSMSEDDAHLQTLCRMSENQVVDLSPPSTATGDLSTHRIIEYYSGFHAVSVLGDALGHASRRRLVQIDLPGPAAGSVVERELSRLDAVDRAYLEQRRVHDIPSKDFCDSLIRLFFEHVFPYTPVLDRVQFVTDYQRGNCSAFLLYSIFSITIPYADEGTLRAGGFADAPEAQREFFTRARLLHDFGCEKCQLSLLQGSVFMSSFQHSFAPDKDFRFWFANAARIATQMGLHRKLEQDLPPRMYRVCRRIWWLLYQRDFVFALSGFENTRRLNDDDADTPLLELSDWDEDHPPESRLPLMRPCTAIHKHFSIEMCKLAQLGFRCLHLCRAVREPWSIDKARELSDGVRSWRSALPPELRIESVSSWTAANVWVIVIHAMSFRLECLFYRNLRQRAQGVDGPEFRWLHQQLLAAMFELSTLFRRAMAHDVIQYGPPSLIVTSTQLTALQIEEALNPRCSRTQRLSFKTEIHAMMQYLQGTKGAWSHAKWAIQALDGVVRATGLALHEARPPPDSWPAWDGSGSAESGRPGHSGQEHGGAGGAADQPDLLSQPQPWDGFPDNWFWDMTDAGLLGGLDEGVHEIMGAPL